MSKNNQNVTVSVIENTRSSKKHPTIYYKILYRNASQTDISTSWSTTCILDFREEKKNCRFGILAMLYLRKSIDLIM